MKALSILALLTIASPAFAQVPAEKQSAPVQDQKPFLYDRAMPNDSCPPAPETVAGTTITIGGATITPLPSIGQSLSASPQPSPQGQKRFGTSTTL
jgi:hypothetical protein